MVGNRPGWEGPGHFSVLSEHLIGNDLWARGDLQSFQASPYL